MILISSLLVASIANAENEAVYNPETGVVEIPVLSVKGQAEEFSVILQQQEKEDLIFTLSDAIPVSSRDQPTNKATYDPETGIAIIPALMVSGDEDSSAITYSVELQQTEESIFEVTQIQDISIQTSEGVSGITPSGSSSESAFLFGQQVPRSRRWCTGTPSQTISVARWNFKSKCGETWNDQKGHVCDYKPDGYHCHGIVSATPPTRIIQPLVPVPPGPWLNPSTRKNSGIYFDNRERYKNWVVPPPTGGSMQTIGYKRWAKSIKPGIYSFHIQSVNNVEVILFIEGRNPARIKASNRGEIEIKPGVTGYALQIQGAWNASNAGRVRITFHSRR